MVFVAIILGFFVENQREDYVDHQQERQYIRSLIEDLEADTSNLSVVIHDYNLADLRLDTVISFFPKITKGYNDTLWRNFLGVRRFPDFIYSDRTMHQLKNSGAMRLIRNQKAADGIITYDAEVRSVLIDVLYLSETLRHLDKTWMQMVDVEGLEREKKVKSIQQLEQEKLVFLLVTDRANVGNLNNQIRRFKYVSNVLKTAETNLKATATQLIELLKKEYQIQ